MATLGKLGEVDAERKVQIGEKSRSGVNAERKMQRGEESRSGAVQREE